MTPNQKIIEYAQVMIAFANGETIEISDSENSWKQWCGKEPPAFASHRGYRTKPKKIPVAFKVARVGNDYNFFKPAFYDQAESSSWFNGWATDEIIIEVTE